MAWISTKDREPELNDIVMIRTSDGDHSALVSKGYKYKGKGGGIYYVQFHRQKVDALIGTEEVTHWMPISAGPKEK